MTRSRRDFLATAGGSLVAGGLLAATASCRPSAALAFGRRASRAPFEVPGLDRVDLIGHVLNRTTFGVRPGDREGVRGLAVKSREAVQAWLERQLEPDTLEDRETETRLRRVSSVAEPVGELYEYKPEVLLQDLTTATLLRAAWSRRQLKEVMVEFWTDHFNIDMSKGDCAWLKMADDREVIRQHCFGRFADLLRASASSPAMLWYLDGRLNGLSRAGDRPNENYARELLELHTLGVHGGYTQRDVMEVARCLTGWTVRPRGGFRKGAVEFLRERHDDGEKAVLGRRIPPGLGAGDLDRLAGPLAGLYDTDPILAGPARHARQALSRIRCLAERDDPPAAGATYMERDTFSAGLRQLARLIKADVGLEVACIDLAGWDTHFLQADAVAALARRLAQGLTAFATDLGPRLALTSIVVMTEFGRRLHPNSALGTDHGRGSMMFVLGGTPPGACTAGGRGCTPRRSKSQAI